MRYFCTLNYFQNAFVQLFLPLGARLVLNHDQVSKNSNIADFIPDAEMIESGAEGDVI